MGWKLYFILFYKNKLASFSFLKLLLVDEGLFRLGMSIFWLAETYYFKHCKEKTDEKDVYLFWTQFYCFVRSGLIETFSQIILI